MKGTPWPSSNPSPCWSASCSSCACSAPSRYWGFETGDGAAAQVLLGVGVPVAAAVVWGMFIAPKARHPVPLAVWIGLQVVLFGAAALGLAAVASTGLAVLFVIAVVLHGAAMAALGLRGAPRP